MTITTVHAAKGLEWPVVFIPAGELATQSGRPQIFWLTISVEQGTYPSYRCTEAHEIAEERRLLYVAMTRAQLFLVSWIHRSPSQGRIIADHLDYVALSIPNDGWRGE